MTVSVLTDGGVADDTLADGKLAAGSLAAADILDLLTALADKSLVEVEPEVLGQARYRMLETVREYASGWLELAGETAMMRRRMRAYTQRECEQLAAIGMARVRAPWSARVAVFRRVDLEAANLREVLSACLADGDAETGLRICTAILPVWLVRGAFADGATWLDAFIELPAVAGTSAAVRGPALVGRAQLALAMGSDRAEELATAGLELCWAAGEPFWVATALNLLTESALHSGRTDEAAARAAEALRVARSSGDRWNEGYALGTMASAAAMRGNMRDAERLGEEAIAVTRAIGQQWGSARGLLGLGDLARLRGQDQRAADHYLEALAILREVNARPEIARCLAGLGRIAMNQSDLPAARRHLTESLQLSFASGSRIGIARGLEAIARLAVLEHDPATGRSASRRGLRAARRSAPAAVAGGQDAAIPGRRRRPGRACRDPALAGRHGHDASAGRPARTGVWRRLPRRPRPRPRCPTAAARPAMRAPTTGARRRPAPQEPRHRSTDAARARGRRAPWRRAEQPRHRQEAVHQPGDRRPARRQHPGQARLQLAQPGRCVGERRVRRPPAQPAPISWHRLAGTEQRAD